MFERRKNRSSGTGGQLAVNMRVRVSPGTDAESRGVVVEDFGEMAAQPVQIGGHHIDPARRWAVVLATPPVAAMLPQWAAAMATPPAMLARL